MEEQKIFEKKDRGNFNKEDVNFQQGGILETQDDNGGCFLNTGIFRSKIAKILLFGSIVLEEIIGGGAGKILIDGNFGVKFVYAEQREPGKTEETPEEVIKGFLGKLKKGGFFKQDENFEKAVVKIIQREKFQEADQLVQYFRNSGLFPKDDNCDSAYSSRLKLLYAQWKCDMEGQQEREKREEETRKEEREKQLKKEREERKQKEREKRKQKGGEKKRMNIFEFLYEEKMKAVV